MQSLGLRHEIFEGDLLELEWIVHSPSHSPENYLGQAETNAVDSLSVGLALRSPVPVIVSALTAGGGSPQSGFVCLAGLM
jgi:hypothetical protein